MGRTKYTEEERARIMTMFIRAAREIIDAEGIDNLSIRKIAALTGMNSATMYLYFPDSDVLTTMALMGYLEKYCRSLAADMPQMKTPENALFHSWEVFCQYAFANPDVFRHIFFCRHTVPLGEIIDRYYQLFPDQLKNIRGNVLDMLREGSIEDRSWKVLWPVAQERGFTENQARIINEMIIAYFRDLLEERCRESDGLLKSVQLSDKMKHAIQLLLRPKEQTA